MSAWHSSLRAQPSLGARQATYDLLARLYLAEPDAALARRLRGLPGFAELLPEEAQLGTWLEEEAAEYQWLFGMNVYPYESIFVDRELMLNTEAAGRVAALYRECGYDADGSMGKAQGAPDHLGLELGLMRHLVAVEREAYGSGGDELPGLARLLQARCLHDHIARWAPIFALTIERVARRPLYRLLASLTLEMVMEEVGVVDPGSGIRGRTLVDIETPDSPLPEGEQGINSVVRRLITPAEVGVFISRADINNLAGSLELPVPMGDRFQMLRGLFEAAGQFEALLPLLDSLGALFARSDDSLAQLAASCPAWAPYGLPWRERVAEGVRLVGDLRKEAHAGL